MLTRILAVLGVGIWCLFILFVSVAFVIDRGLADLGVVWLAVFGLGLALTSGSLALVHATTDPSRAVEVTALVLANLAATLLRFVLLRRWVFTGCRT